MHILIISRHSPESIPFNDPKKMQELVKLHNTIIKSFTKNGIKKVGMWVDLPEHTTYGVIEVPSMEAYLKALRTPEFLAALTLTNIETKIVLTEQEAMSMIAQH